MSGPKSTHIRPSRSRAAHQRLRHLLPALRNAESASRTSAAAADLQRLEGLIRALRAELAQFRAPQGSRGESLSIIRSAEAFLGGYRHALSSRPEADTFAANARAIGLALAGDSALDIDTLRLSAERLLSCASEAEAACEQMRGVERAVEGALAAARPNAGAPAAAGRVEEELCASLRHAIGGTIDAERSALANAPVDVFALGGLDQAAHGRMLSSAGECARTGDIDSANRAIGEARRLREQATHAGNEIRERIAQREALALRLKAALESRNYDSVHDYYKKGAPAGDAAPLVLYASSPAGTANVRVTLGVDGSMLVEVDGVAIGEEEVCLDVLQAFSRTIADGGDTLEIRDLGRAGRVQVRSDIVRERQSRERQV